MPAGGETAGATVYLLPERLGHDVEEGLWRDDAEIIIGRHNEVARIQKGQPFDLARRGRRREIGRGVEKQGLGRGDDAGGGQIGLLFQRWLGRAVIPPGAQDVGCLAQIDLIELGYLADAFELDELAGPGSRSSPIA